MKKIIIVCLILLNNLCAEVLELDLVTFSNLASETNQIDILIDEKLKEEKFVFTTSSNKDYLLTAFRKALNTKGLQLVQNEKFFYIEKKEIYVETPQHRSIKINFVNFEDIKELLTIYKDIEYNFIKTSKTLILKSTFDQYNNILKVIKSIDKLPKQLKLKISIIETNLNKSKEFGFDFEAKIKSDPNTNLFFNLISYPFSITNTLTAQQTNQFYTFLKMTNENDYTEFISNPTIILSDEKTTLFKSIEEVPYKKSTTQIENNQTVNTESIEYKEVGLSVKVKPSIYSFSNVYLDLDFEASNILSFSDNIPTTSSKIVKQAFNLKVGETLILTGINKNTLTTNNIGIPFLKDIPFIGNLFNYEYESKLSTNLSIIFELQEI